MKRRGKAVAITTAGLAIVVLVLAGKDHFVEWYAEHFGGREIRVILRWDPVTRATVRSVGKREAARDDQELVQTIRERANGFTWVGNTTWPLVIDAAPQVPWRDVVRMMDLCKENGIERLEFASPQH